MNISLRTALNVTGAVLLGFLAFPIVNVAGILAAQQLLHLAGVL